MLRTSRFAERLVGDDEPYQIAPAVISFAGL
jgi:hypothetical protein